MIRSSTIARHVGRRYGRLTILSFDRIENRTQYFFNCRCDCGTERSMRLGGMQQGNTVSCGCYGKENRAAINSGNTYRRLPTGENAKNSLFKNYKDQAAQRGVLFDLTRDEFVQLTEQPCYYCGCAPRHIKKPNHSNGSHTYNGVDRVDNSKGYTTDNCVPACRPCNSAKNAVTKDMVVKIYQFLFPRTEPVQRLAA
jgi:hypothetical protein